MTRWRKVRKSERGIFEPDLSEEQILRVIVEEIWLRYRIKLWRINCAVGGKVRPNERGIPDLVGYIDAGYFPDKEDTYAVPLFIEVKVPGGRRRPEQIAFIADATAAGCIAFFAESWEDVQSELDHHGVQP